MGNVMNHNENINLEDIVFISKKKMGVNDSNDVFISIVKKGKTTKEAKVLKVYLRDTISEVFKNEKYLVVGIIDNRMYFKPLNNSKGFKIQKGTYTRYVIVTLTLEEEKMCEKFSNLSYHLEHDDNLDLYYIEAPEKTY